MKMSSVLKCGKDYFWKSTLKCHFLRQWGFDWEEFVIHGAGPSHRAASVSLLLGPEFPLTTWFSVPHLSWISMLTDVPKPLEPANKGAEANRSPWHTDWCSQTDGPQERLTCSTEGIQNILRSAAPQSAAHIWAADVPVSRKEAAAHFFMRAWLLVYIRGGSEYPYLHREHITHLFFI